MSRSKEPLCIDGGKRHDFARFGLDVYKDKLVWSSTCTYCPAIRRKAYRGWKRGLDGKVRT